MKSISLALQQFLLVGNSVIQGSFQYKPVENSTLINSSKAIQYEERKFDRNPLQFFTASFDK